MVEWAPKTPILMIKAWLLKPRSTMHVHLSSNSGCRNWQMKLSGRKVPEAEHKCTFCARCFYKPEDRDQHEYSCGKRRPEEPADPPRARPREIKKAEKQQKKEKERLRYEGAGS